MTRISSIDCHMAANLPRGLLLAFLEIFEIRNFMNCIIHSLIRLINNDSYRSFQNGIIFFVSFVIFISGNTFCRGNALASDSIKAENPAVLLLDIPQKAVATTRIINTEINEQLHQQLLFETREIIDSIQNESVILKEVSNDLIEANLPYSFYQSLLLRWSRVEDKIEKPENSLKDYSSNLSELSKMLRAEKIIWEKTSQETLDKDSPPDLIDRVNLVIDQIDSANQILEDSIGLSLNLLNKIVEVKLTCGNSKLLIEATQTIQFNEMIKIRKDPVWAMDFSMDSTISIEVNEDLIDFGMENAREYMATNKYTFVKLGVIFVVLLIVIFWLRRQSEKLDVGTEIERNTALFLVAKPIPSALMLAILWAMKSLPEMPYFLFKIISFIYLIPFLFVFRGIIRRPLSWSL